MKAKLELLANMELVPGIGADIASKQDMRDAVQRMQATLSKMPQYEPVTKHYFHAGMYCREVYRDAGVLVIGKVHKKAHFYIITSGTVCITTDDGAKRVTGPAVLKCEPGTKRAVYAETPTTCMTFHIVNATTVEEAERELVEDDETSMYGVGNIQKDRISHESKGVLS